ncbi:MAG: tripartite tricarboxylate transporter TctB family protein [Candidatus Binatia bacterium]
MNDTREDRRTIDPSFWLSGFFVAVIAAGVITAAEWRWDTRLFPWVIGIPALALALWQMTIDFRGGRFGAQRQKSSSREPVDIPADASVPAEIRTQRTWRAIGWIGGFALAIWLLGFLIAIPLFIFCYLIYEAQCGKILALVLAGCMELFIWSIFELLMHLAWPEAALFAFFR